MSNTTSAMYILVNNGPYKGYSGYIKEGKKNGAICVIWVNQKQIEIFLDLKSFDFVGTGVL